jgi:hypothetical protein
MKNFGTLPLFLGAVKRNQKTMNIPENRGTQGKTWDTSKGKNRDTSHIFLKKNMGSVPGFSLSVPGFSWNAPLSPA